MQRFRLSSGLSGATPRSGARRLTPTLAALCLPGLLGACSPSDPQNTPPGSSRHADKRGRISGVWHGAVLAFNTGGVRPDV